MRLQKKKRSKKKPKTTTKKNKITNLCVDSKNPRLFQPLPYFDESKSFFSHHFSFTPSFKNKNVRFTNRYGMEKDDKNDLVN
jgi:hypothetical protein